MLVTGTGARLQIANLRVDAVEDNPVRLEGSNNRLDLFSLRCVRFNTRANNAAAIHLADSGAAAPNTVYLGSPALLEGPPTPGPLVNTGTNGVLSKQAPAGRAARPGLAVGGPDAGLFAPSRHQPSPPRSAAARCCAPPPPAASPSAARPAATPSRWRRPPPPRTACW